MEIPEFLQRRAGSALFNDSTQNKADDALGSMCSGPIRSNPCGVMEGNGPWPSVADGYWVMMKPLSAGPHDLSFGAKQGFGPDSSFELSVSYALNVTP